ncbi:MULTISPECIES: OmpA family protein [Halomonadaceae]|uniref:OmpA/MotB family protein n=1 Tax=Halomonadaceae TaxID=28256 RepID=UPI00159A59FA|nr:MULTISPECIES: OmpA family protein [Halomonas]QJQ94896.1 OmpA family protein [Halomonas sp. PA5]
MSDPRQHQDLLPGSGGEDEGESWLISYLDVLTLLITLFVLLLSLAGNGLAEQGQLDSGLSSSVSETDSQSRTQSQDGSQLAGQLAVGLQLRQSGLLPQLEGRMPSGVSVTQGSEGVTLRIDDNLLFASGQADLTGEGRQVLAGLLETLLAFDGRISVEGHTDNVPISTSHFPSNWELSGARAIAVVRYLEQRDIDDSRLRAIGYADTQPLESNDTAEGRAANRRVELVLHEGTSR